MASAISVSDRRWPDAAIARFITRALAADPPRARSLTVTVWGDALAPHGGALWLRALIPLMAGFGVGERSVRTSVYRLAADGWLRSQTRGRESRYGLTPAGQREFAGAYRRIYFPHADGWDGRWQVVIAPPQSLSAGERATLRQRFAWSGFGLLAPGVFARPLGAQGDVIPAPASTRAKLTVLTACDDAQHRDAPLADWAAHGFDLANVAAAYRVFIARYRPAIELFRGHANAPPRPQDCFVVRSLLIHAFRRVLLRDPLLPPALLPADWPGAAAYSLTRDVYRLVWRAADAHLAFTLGDDFRTASGEFARRFGGLE